MYDQTFGETFRDAAGSRSPSEEKEVLDALAITRTPATDAGRGFEVGLSSADRTGRPENRNGTAPARASRPGGSRQGDAFVRDVLRPPMARVRRVTVSGRRSFEYVSQGKGPATLLVHPGGPGWTYHYLRALLRLASANFRVILFNPRGVGHSWAPKRASDYSIADLAGDVEAIRRALRITELHLLGYSTGGFVALEYAHRYERHLTSLLLCATAGS